MAEMLGYFIKRAKKGLTGRIKGVGWWQRVLAESLVQISKLQAECFELAAGCCIHPKGITGGDGGSPICPLQAKNKELEDQLAKVRKMYDDVIIEQALKGKKMSENRLMEVFRKSYCTVDIESLLGNVRLLNAHLRGVLNTLNRVLNEKDDLQAKNKELREAIEAVLPQISAAKSEYENARYIDSAGLRQALKEKE